MGVEKTNETNILLYYAIKAITVQMTITQKVVQVERERTITVAIREISEYEDSPQCFHVSVYPTHATSALLTPQVANVKDFSAVFEHVQAVCGSLLYSVFSLPELCRDDKQSTAHENTSK